MTGALAVVISVAIVTLAATGAGLFVFVRWFGFYENQKLREAPLRPTPTEELRELEAKLQVLSERMDKLALQRIAGR